MEISIQNPAKSGEPTMLNITVAVSDDSYRQARIWAAKKDTSVSAVMHGLLLGPGSRRNGKITHPSATFALNQ
jgi:hypothetical protein